MLDLGEAGQLAPDGRQHVRTLAARQELQPIALQPAEHRDRQVRATPFRVVIERDAECSANAVALRELQRQARAEHPWVRQAARRTAQMLAELLAAQLELRCDERAERFVVQVPPVQLLAEPAMQVDQLLPPLRAREESLAAVALDEIATGVGDRAVLDEAPRR